MVKIEAMNNNGNWIQLHVVQNVPVYIRQKLVEAAKSGIASKTRKSRAVDMATGNLIDIYQG